MDGNGKIMTVEISKQMWNAFDGIEETINKLLAVRDVVSLNTLPNEEIVKLIDAMVEMFSDKQKIVWDEYRNQQKSKEYEFDDIEINEAIRLNELEREKVKGYEKQIENLENLARNLTNDYIQLETKYNKLALYDTRDQHIEDLTKENTYLIRQIEEIKANNTFGINNEEFEKINNHIKELTIQKEYYQDQSKQLRYECDRWEEKYSRMEADYNNFVKTVRTVSQHPSHD